MADQIVLNADTLVTVTEEATTITTQNAATQVVEVSGETVTAVQHDTLTVEVAPSGSTGPAGPAGTGEPEGSVTVIASTAAPQVDIQYAANRYSTFGTDEPAVQFQTSTTPLLAAEKAQTKVIRIENEESNPMTIAVRAGFGKLVGNVKITAGVYTLAAAKTMVLTLRIFTDLPTAMWEITSVEP